MAKRIAFLLLIIVVCSGEYYWFGRSARIDILSGKYQMFSQISTFDGQHQVTGDGSKQGYLAYGPYLPLSEGAYTVRFKLRLKDGDIRNPDRKVGLCDVNLVNHPEKNVSRELTVRDFRRGNQFTAALRFSVPEGTSPAEFRVLLYGGNHLTMEGLNLQPHNLGQAISLVKNSYLKYNFLLIILVFMIAVAVYIYREYRKVKIKGGSFTYEEAPESQAGIPVSFLIQFGVVSFFALLALNAKFMDILRVPILPANQSVWLTMESGLLLLFFKIFKWPGLKVQFRFYDTGLFIAVFGMIAWLLLKPAWPALMPINFSNDCVIHFAGIDYIFNRGTIAGANVSSYPFAYHLVTAMLAGMTGLAPIKMMQLLLIFSTALSTAITYAIINRIFKLTKDGQMMSIIILLTLFWVRGYYELAFNQFFHAPMIFSYLFMVSFLWAMIEYKKYPKWFIFLALNFSAIGLIYAYTSYLPLLVLPFTLLVLFDRGIKFKTKCGYLLIALLPAIFLAVLHLKAGGTTKLGLSIMYHEGYCIPFRFRDFGDFGDHKIGGMFLIWSFIGLVIFCASAYANSAVLFFTFGFLLYFGIFFVLKRYFNIFSYYQAYKTLYFAPYLAIIYETSILQLCRKYFLQKVKPIIGESIHKILAVFWLFLILWLGLNVYKMESYKPVYIERITEPVFLTTDWARKNIKDRLYFIYHHPNIGNWMRQGFMDERMNDQYYGEVFGSPLPTIENWLKKAQSGEIAVVDDLNNPPLADLQRQQLEILYQKENSAVIKKR